MQGKHEYQPQLFATVNLEILIPKNHLLRRLDAVLDLGFIREWTKELYCADNGRPSIDPELFFRMVLIEYFFNIESDRQVCEEVGYNLAYRWYCRLSLEDDVPHHSSLTRIRDRLGEEIFKRVFLHIIELCKQKGLAKAQKVVTDGTWVKANAALNSLVEKSPEKKDPPDSDGDQKPRSSTYKGKKFSNQTHVSQTDPDSTLSGKDTEAKSLRYKIHGTADADSRVILDCHVTTGSVHDCKPYIERIQEIEKTFGSKITDASADRGYGTGEILQFLKEKGIQSWIPRFHRDAGEKVDRAATPYSVEKDEFACEKGNRLVQRGKEKTGALFYRPELKSCESCEKKQWCVIKRHGLRVSQFHQVHYETQLREPTKEFRKKMGERQWKIEGLWAEAKCQHGMARAKYRGRSKMQIQAYVTASVQNLKRLMSAVLTNPGPNSGDFSAFLEIRLQIAAIAKFLSPIPQMR